MCVTTPVRLQALLGGRPALGNPGYRGGLFRTQEESPLPHERWNQRPTFLFPARLQAIIGRGVGLRIVVRQQLGRAGVYPVEVSGCGAGPRGDFEFDLRE